VNSEVWGQRAYSVRFDWGPTGAARVATPGGILVVIDVLSFTTAVGVAVERGITVYPAPWRDARAYQLAKAENAVLAVGRKQATAAHPWSLSPAAMRTAPFIPRLVLPSPNGSSIAAAAEEVTVVAASLRNAALVGRWLRGVRTEGPVAVIAAGERWPDGSLRPALEDALGAGAVLSSMMAEPGDLVLSPEAAAVRAMYDATPSPAAAVRASASGEELVEAGFAEDVEVAAEVGTGTAIPVMSGGAFRMAELS
jgi:2-phosphosulfolactate phosphatase